MKKVLVLNGDSYVGRHVVRSFYQSHEYDVEITRAKADVRKATANRAGAMADTQGWMWTDAMTRDGAEDQPPSPDSASNARRKQCLSTSSSSASQQRQRLQQEERASLPADIRACVCGVVPKHNDDTEAFRKRLLASDVVVAVLEDDAYEATCAIRMLESTHYEVEKTFVLVSSAVTWAYTLEAERARARANRQREREEARNSFLEELLDEEEEGREDGGGEGAGAAAAREARRTARRQELELRLPHSLRDPLPGEDEEEIRELVPDRVFTEGGYAQRVPHPRFQHWHTLEHLVKRANTQTLHTYVVFAGLPYGAGEGEAVLYGLLRSAWYHQPLLQYGSGTNAMAMIHVQDLAAIVFKLGNSFDTLDERYLFAVDQGRVTQRQLLQAVQAKLGGSVQPAKSSRYRPLDAAAVPASPAATTLVAASGASVSVSASAMANNASVTNTVASSVLAQSHPPPTAVAAAPSPSANLVTLDRLELPPPTTAPALFHVFGNEPCWGDGGALLSALVLSDIQAEPTAVLNIHAAEEWVALEGFAATLDIVLAQFREAHGQRFRPVRMLITGPPLSGAETVAALVARQCHAPLLTLPTLVRDFSGHVAEMREALRVLLVRRLQRRRDRVQARLVRQAVDAKHTRRAARAARRLANAEAKRQRRGGDGEDDENDGDEAAVSDAEDEDGETGAADTDDGSSDESMNSSISLFIPMPSARAAGDGEHEGGEEDADEDGDDEGEKGRTGRSAAEAIAPHSRPTLRRAAEDVVDEAYIRGAAAAGEDAADDEDMPDGEEGGAGMVDEEQEEAGGDGDGDGDGEGGATWLDKLEEQDAERQAALMESQELLPEAANANEEAPSPLPRFAARQRGRAFARDVDRQELRCIAALRQEYLLGLKVLALRVSAKDGRLPRPPQPPASEDNDDDGDAEERTTVNDKTGKSALRGQRDDEDEHVEEDDASGGASEHDSDASDRRGKAHSTEDAPSSEEEDEAEEGEEDDDAVSSAAGSNTSANVAAADAESASSDFLDHALAFMYRWRVRQADCRCQGYVLGDFPQTLAQAVLCFKANGAELEDAELRRQRALAPLLGKLDDHNHGNGEDGEEEAPLPPPLDEDFPLPDIVNMSDAQLRALEAAHWAARGGRVGAAAAAADADAAQSADGDVEESGAMEPEEVMAAVDEALFVDHVVSLQANATLLRATVEALETNLSTTTACASPGAEKEANEQALASLRTCLSSAPYAARLEQYLRHHAVAAPPTQSLLAWLSAVTTTPALGVRPAPVIVAAFGDAADADRLAGTDPSGEAGADEGAATTLEAPSTTRTAEMVEMPAPVLSVAEVKASWCTAYAALQESASSNIAGEGSALVHEKLPIALLRLAPLFWTGGASATVQSSAPHVSNHRQRHHHRRPLRGAAAKTLETASLPAPLGELHRVLCARLVPHSRLTACAAATAAAAVAAAAPNEATEGRTPLASVATADPIAAGNGVRAVNALLNGGSPRETNFMSNISGERVEQSELEGKQRLATITASKVEEVQVQRERATLRKLQLSEESRDADALLEMPTETYLMKFVLPSLTPAMTEVVRTRSNDPVTALADVLFDYHRRTTIKGGR